MAIILLEVPFQVDTYLFYQDALSEVGAIGGLNVSLSTVCLTALYALWTARYLRQNRVVKVPAIRWNLPLTCYVASIGVSLLFAAAVHLAVFELWLTLQAYLLYLYIVNHLTTRKDIVFVLVVLTAGLWLEGLTMCAVRFIGDTIQLGPLRAERYLSSRIAGTLGSPIAAAAYLATLIAPATSLLATPLSARHKMLSLLSIAFGAAALVFTLSRGGWIAFLFSVSIVLFALWFRGWLPTGLASIVILSSLVVLSVFSVQITGRVTGDDSGSARARSSLAGVAIEIIQDYPLFGVGANNCARVAATYANQSPYRGEWFYTVHNKYLLVWVETGILGLIGFLWFLVSTVRTGWQSWMQRDRLLSPIALGCTAAVTGQMIHMSVDVFNSRPQTTMLWIVAACIPSISYVLSVEADDR